MTYNKIFIPTTGIDPAKFINIPAFAPYSKNGMVKLMIPDFLNAGKVKKYVCDHAIAEHHRNYEWNGYGYSDHDNFYLLSRKDAQTVKNMIADKNKRPQRTEEDIKKAWARRLASLTNIDIESAMEIADEKLEYQQKKIYEMECRQDAHFSVMREKLIKKMYRENPLRRIENAEHAYAILAASNRHNFTDYDDRLAEARELAELGEIDRDDVKQYARHHMESRLLK